MDVIAELVKLLKPIVGGRVRPDVMPQGESVPAIRLMQMGGQTAKTICGGDNANDDVPRIYVEIYSKDSVERRELELKVRKAISDARMGAELQTAPVHQYHGDAKYFISTLDYLFF